MIKIAICDDEEFFRKKIMAYIEEYLRKIAIPYEIDTFQSGNEFISLGASMLGFTVVFLDINMSGMNGVEVARQLRKISKKIYIVFITAYLDYTLEGYKVEAIRYIVKKNKQLKGMIEECMDAIFEKMNYSIESVSFRFNEGEKIILLERLIYVESKLHKLEFHIMEAEEMVYTLYDTLNKIEKEVEDQGFVRIHQSFLVNMRHIKSIEHYTMTLNNGNKFIIPRARYKSVKEIYIAYRGEM